MENNTKKTAIEKLNEARNHKLIYREQIGDVELMAQCQVAKKDSEVFLPYLTILRIENQFYAVCHSKLLPKTNDIKDFKNGVGWYKVDINICVADVIKSGIKKFQEKHIRSGLRYFEAYHVNSYSFLMGYCMANGVNLVEEGVFNV